MRQGKWRQSHTCAVQIVFPGWTFWQDCYNNLTSLNKRSEHKQDVPTPAVNWNSKLQFICFKTRTNGEITYLCSADVPSTIWVTLPASKAKTRNAMERRCSTVRTTEPNSAIHRCPLSMTFRVESCLRDWLKPKVWRDLPQLWLVNLTCSPGAAANVSAGLQNRKWTSHPRAAVGISLGSSASLWLSFSQNWA